MIELSRVTFAYSPASPWERRALRGVDISIAGGERVLVTGGNGSGKTTLAWLLAGLIEPSSGSVTVDGRPASEVDGDVALGFQHARLQLFRPTVADDVGFGTDLDTGAVSELLELVGLSAQRYGDRPIDTLSGGELRRVAIAGLLARRPRVLVLDEPFAGLDGPARSQLVDVLARLQEREGLATVIVSHDVEETAPVADRVIVLEAGRVVSDGPLDGAAAPPATDGPPSETAEYTPLRRGRGATMADLQLFRYVDGDSVLHRMRPGTKIVCALALALAAAAAPRWTSVGILCAALVLALGAARIPRGAAPRVPRWVLVAVAASGVLAAVAGGEPAGLGGLLDWARLMLLGLASLTLGLLLGWTTPVGALGPSIARLLTPLRVFRFPVQELATLVALVVRCLPLLFEEMRTLAAAYRLRRHRVPPGMRARIVFVHDLLVTALTTSMRRAQEMAAAIEARGGIEARAPGRLSLGLVDVAALVATAAAAAAMLLL